MKHFAPFALLPLVAACTVGPNYGGPPSATSAGSLTPFVRGNDVVRTEAPALTTWWESLNDPVLSALQTRALAGNPGIAIAQARMRQARGAMRLDRANQLPGANAQGRYIRAQIPEVKLRDDDSIRALNLFNVGFDASWEIDLFGGQRRTAEASRALAAAAEANVADAQVQLSAEVAHAYVNLRDRQTQLALATDAAGMQSKMLELTRQRYAAGTASALDAERLQTQYATALAQLVPIKSEIEVLMNALAMLVGEQPGALDADLATAAPIPLVPVEVKVGDPTALLQRRPDIRAAERNLAAQTAKIGVAEAARFPRLRFMGILGLGGTSLSALADLSHLSAVAAPQLQWQFLDFGRNAARVEQTKGARDEAEAQYRQAVLAALTDAEDALSRFSHRRESVIKLAQVKASADRAAALTEQRYRAGAGTVIDTLDAERQRVAASQNLASATAGLTNDYIALQKALGLGWSSST